MLEERRLVQLSWELIGDEAPAFADGFIARLVEHDPGMHVLTTAPGTEPAEAFLRWVRRIIALAEEPNRLVEFLIAAGVELAKLGVSSRDHDAARAALFGALAETLGERFTPEMDEAWHELFAVVSAVILRAGIARGPSLRPTAPSTRPRA